MKRETKAEAVTAIEVDSTHTFDCICGACQRDRVNNPITAREKKLILRNGMLRQEKVELLEALRELLTSEESPHSETVRYLAREQARTILAKIGGKQ